MGFCFQLSGVFWGLFSPLRWFWVLFSPLRWVLGPLFTPQMVFAFPFHLSDGFCIVFSPLRWFLGCLVILQVFFLVLFSVLRWFLGSLLPLRWFCIPFSPLILFLDCFFTPAVDLGLSFHLSAVFCSLFSCLSWFLGFSFHPSCILGCTQQPGTFYSPELPSSFAPSAPERSQLHQPLWERKTETSAVIVPFCSVTAPTLPAAGMAWTTKQEQSPCSATGASGTGAGTARATRTVSVRCCYFL